LEGFCPFFVLFLASGLYIRRIPRIAIHFCPKMVTFESGPKVVAIDEIW